jgi:uncharacterized membrane protein
METAKRPVAQVFMLVLALLGVGISIYLTLVHYDQKNVPLVCSTRGFINCENVLTSPYALVPGTSIPISIPGLLWCLIAAGLALVAWRWRPFDRRIVLAEVVWSGLGLLSVFYLVYVELVRLHTLCAWCTTLHVLILGLFISALLQFQRMAEDEEEEGDEEEKEVPLPSSTFERR